MASDLRFIVTTGDPDGIGWEVTVKALNKLGPQKNVQFIVMRSANALRVPPKWNKKFRVQPAPSLEAALQDRFDSKWLIEVRSDRSAAHWVEDAAKMCLQKKCAGLITAPLSKTAIIESGLKDIGHTEILSRISGETDLFMGFWGAKFNVMLATGHAPLNQAIQGLSMAKLTKALRAAYQFKKLLPSAIGRRPMALVGVNPHAGEHGLLGSEEGWFKGLIESLRPELGRIDGPLVPDAAYLPERWKNYSIYIAPYHDQGLIPFKMIHGFKTGVHLTLGLPFVRTSVDHGTAKEIFGRNKAEAGSMVAAIKLAIQLGRARAKGS